MVTDRHWTGSKISDNCHGLVLSVASSTVLDFSTLRLMGSTPFLIEKAKTIPYVTNKYYDRVNNSSNSKEINNNYKVD
jgi:hypothetical protein